jgi:membrane protein YqaA with SNARE-associated domain
LNDSRVKRITPLGESPPTERRPSKAQQFMMPVAAFLVSVIISAGILLLRGHMRQFAALGYLGVLAISLLSNATLILPAPGAAVIFAAAASGLNPFLVGVIAGLGAAVGELTGYLTGYAGHAVIENRGFYNRITPWIRRFGPVAIFVFAAIPNPLFDIAGIAAGILRMPFWLFFLSCWAGKTVNMTLIAYLGTWSAPLFGG